MLDGAGMEEGRELKTNGRCTELEIASPVNTVGFARFCDMVGVNGEETDTVGCLRSWSLIFSCTFFVPKMRNQLEHSNTTHTNYKEHITSVR